MWYGFLADGVVVVHLMFVAFALLGGWLVLWRRKIAWVHLPAAGWAVAVEWAGWYCPLTPLEVWLRAKAGAEGYVDGFVGHYLLKLLYPVALTREIQFVLGVVVVVSNAAIYWAVLRRRAQRRRAEVGGGRGL